MVINQFASIGDIIFLEPMYRHFWNKTGSKPIVPVRDHLFWLADYIDSARFVKMSQYPMDYESTRMDDNYFPARFANQVYRKLSKYDHSDLENMMLDKYRLAGLDPEMWKTIKLDFKDGRSVQLMQDLKLMEPDGKVVNKEFMLINQYSQAGWISIDPKTEMKKVRMTERSGYTPIDWHLLMQMATENHHVSTSTFFIMQAIANQFHFDSTVYLYPRPNEDGLRGISQLNPTFKIKRMS